MNIKYIKYEGRRIKKYFLETNEEGEEVFIETPEWSKIKKEIALKRKIEISNIPPHVIDLSLNNYIGEDREKIEKLKIFIQKFEDKFKSVSLYFWSKENSTQKTTISAIVGRSLLEKGYKVHFVLMNKLLKLLSEEKFQESHSEELDLIRNSDFLIIDDSFDAKKATVYKSGYQIPFLDEFLRTRLEIEKKSICFSSNFSIEEIDQSVFGLSIKSLIKRAIPDPFHFASSFELRNDFNIQDLWK
jgi:DNA replication protein DnaC